MLALLLLAMAAGQLADLRGFVEVLRTYPVASTPLTWLIALGLVVSEVTAGALLLTGNASMRARGAAAALAVAVAWSALALSALVSSRSIGNCGCFGVYLAQPLRWWVLLEDVEFVALATWVLLAARREAVQDTEGSFDDSASHTR
ncbi:MAG: MauE/DoxX family redox-associated membrane protein [Acidimicrobiia bacterium]